jgi:hypothetical protein
MSVLAALIATVDRTVYGILSDLPAFQRSEGLPATGALMLSLTCRVPYTMRKTGNPWIGRVEVEYTQTAIMGADWRRCVQRAIDRKTPAGETPRQFVLSQPAWGERVEGTPFVVHTPAGEPGPVLYLPVQEWVRRDSKADITYYVDGRLATAEEVAAFSAFHTKSARHTDAKTDDGGRVRLPLIHRRPRVRHIREVKCGAMLEVLEGGAVVVRHRDGREEVLGTL